MFSYPTLQTYATKESSCPSDEGSLHEEENDLQLMSQSTFFQGPTTSRLSSMSERMDNAYEMETSSVMMEAAGGIEVGINGILDPSIGVESEYETGTLKPEIANMQLNYPKPIKTDTNKNSKDLGLSLNETISDTSSDSDVENERSGLPYEKRSNKPEKYLSNRHIIIALCLFAIAIVSGTVGGVLAAKIVSRSEESLEEPVRPNGTLESNVNITMTPTATPVEVSKDETDQPPPPPIQPGQFYFSNIESGPLVGHTTQDSTSIWAFHGQGRTMQLSYHRYGDSISFTAQMPPRPNNNNAAIVTIDGLDENMDYVYELSVDSTVVARGQFKTAPAFKPGKFEYLLTSCMNIEAHKGYPEQPVWDHVLEKNPDFSIMAGDTIYLTEEDWTSDTREVIYDRVWYRNMKQRSDPHFARVIGSFPTYAAWDDHEYGSNNAEKNQPGKENSLKAFKDVWANPGYGTPEIRGNFYEYYWGDVHFIVLDNRWYRDRNQQTQLGNAQKNWLYDKLRNSRGTFKVIVNGCDIMEAGYGRDVDEIGRVVRDNNIDGVIFNAGDIHRNEFKTQLNGNWPYPVTQYSSSGIARDNWMRPWSIIKVDTELADPEITAHFFGADSQALDTTWSNDPNLRCSSIQDVDRWKEARCTETIRLSDLTPN